MIESKEREMIGSRKRKMIQKWSQTAKEQEKSGKRAGMIGSKEREKSGE